MLEEIRISGLGVIEEALLELHPGLNVVTGETGAGKTMVVEGLSLLAGARADSGLVRTGAPRALVEGRLGLQRSGELAGWSHAAGAELDDGSLIVSRSVSIEGRSRAYLGGRNVPVSSLAELADAVLALHGQHGQQRLMRPAEQRAALDRYAGASVEEPLGRYRLAYDRWRQVGAELADLLALRRERAQEADLLRLGVAEVAAVAPVVGEDTALAGELRRLSHADSLREAAEAAHAALAADPAHGFDVQDATGLLADARRALAGAAALDPELAALERRLAELATLTTDVAADLASYAAGIDADPARLAAAQDRQAELSRLLRSYAPSLDEVLAWLERAHARLAELESDGQRSGDLETERDRLTVELAALGEEVSGARTEAGVRFGAAVTAELRDLAMAHGQVSVAVSQQEGSTGGLRIGDRWLACGPDGVDTVELLLTAHPGAPARPLARGASGGELSRVMLAVEVVFAEADPVPTIVFDEVDAGVGGRAAVEVGRRLSRLARDHQVVVVTHLPQVAAFADRHLLVEKADDGRVTRSGVTTLDDAARVRELSRMLAGLEDSHLARGHAEELLTAAASAKAGR